MPVRFARPAALALSSTLLAIAAEPLPSASTIPGMAANTYVNYSHSVPFSWGDVDGDGYIDIAIGGRIFWGSAAGWTGDFFEPLDPASGYDPQAAARGTRALQYSPYQALWIVPNLTGNGGDGKTRADVIGLNDDGDGVLLHAEKSVSEDRVSFSDDHAHLLGLVGQPVVGHFSGSGELDIAWVSTDAGYSNVNLAQGIDGLFNPSHKSISNPDYIAVAGLPTGTENEDDLLIVDGGVSYYDSEFETWFYETAVVRYAFGVTDLNDAVYDSSTLDANRYLPYLTVGDINGDGRADVGITCLGYGEGTGQTTFLISDKESGGLNGKVDGYGVGWIVPDVTGDGVDDVSWGDNSLTTGLIHGGETFATRNDGTVPNVDRTVPVDSQTESAEYGLGYQAYGHSLRFAVVPKAVNELPLSRQLLVIDYTGYSGSFIDTRILPTLYPEFNNSGVTSVNGSGYLADGEFSISFTNDGVFDGLLVTISNAASADSLTYSLPESGSVSSIVPSNFNGEGSTWSYTFVASDSEVGIPVDDLDYLIRSLYLSLGTGGIARDVLMATIGKADPSDSEYVYVGAKLPLTVTPDVPSISIVPDSESGSFVGGAVPFTISGGLGTYHVSASGAVVRTVNLGEGTIKAFVIPTRSGTIQITVTDSNGSTPATTSIEVSGLDPTTLQAPPLAISTGSETIFGPICPGTTDGLASLRHALAGADRRRTRGFAWDAVRQAYTELPSEPDGGLTPTDGVFLASRVDLGLDFSGPALPPGATVMLRTGWNFVGMGPVQVSSDPIIVETVHSLISDFYLTDVSDVSHDFADITAAYRWNGSAYETTDSIQSGVGYWIKSLSTEPLLLVRYGAAQGAQRPRHAVQFARDVGAPPAPPSTDTKAQDDGGSCGAGSGIGAMLGMLLAFLRLRSRQR